MKTVKVQFSHRLRTLFGTSERLVDLGEAASIRDLLALLCDSEVKSESIFGTDGDLRHDVMLTKNGLFVFYLDRLDTPLENGDVVTVFHPASAG